MQRVSKVHARRRMRSACLRAVTQDLREYAATLPREDADSVLTLVGKYEYMASHPPKITEEESWAEMFNKEDTGQ